MAKTYYKHQKRDPSTAINWAEVGSTITQNLKDEAKFREETKAHIDSQTREMLKAAQDNPMGTDSNSNNLSLSIASSYEEALLIQERLMKNGSLNPRDYLQFRQNASDDVDGFYKYIEKFQENHALIMERAESTDPANRSQAVELALAEYAEAFGNFAQVSPVVGENGHMNLGFYEKNADGTLNLDVEPSRLAGVEVLKNAVTKQYDYYDYEKAIADRKVAQGVYETFWVGLGSRYTDKEIGKIKDATLRGDFSGLKLTQDEIDQLTEFGRLQDLWVKEEFSNELNISSFLTDGPTPDNYSVTFDPNEQDEYTILFENKGGVMVPNFDNKFGKMQREAAEEGLKTMNRGAQDREVEIQVQRGATPQRPAAKSSDEKNAEDANTLWNRLRGASLTEKQSIVDGIIGTPQAIQAGLLEINFIEGKEDENGVKKDDTVEFIYENPAKNRTGANAIVIDPNATEQQWSDFGTEFTGGGDLVGFEGDYIPVGSMSAGRQGSTPVAEQLPPLEGLSKYIRQNAETLLPNDALFDKKNQKSKAAIEKAIAPYGGSIASYDTGLGLNGFKIAVNGVTSREFNTNQKTKAAAKAERDALMEFIIANTTEESAKAAIQRGASVAGGGAAGDDILGGD